MRPREIEGDMLAAMRVDAPEYYTTPFEQQTAAADGQLTAAVRLGALATFPDLATSMPGIQLGYDDPGVAVRYRAELSVTPLTPASDLSPPINESQRLEVDAGINGIVLKELTLGDAERIYELVSYDTAHFTDVGETVPEICESVESVRAWLSGLKASTPNTWERVELGAWHGGTLVGCIGYTACKDRAIVWQWIGKAHTGNGFAGDSLRTLVPYLLKCGHPIIEAQVRIDNVASRRNMQSTGFSRISQRNDYIRYRYSGSSNSYTK